MSSESDFVNRSGELSIFVMVIVSSGISFSDFDSLNLVLFSSSMLARLSVICDILCIEALSTDEPMMQVCLVLIEV